MFNKLIAFFITLGQTIKTTAVNTWNKVKNFFIGLWIKIKSLFVKKVPLKAEQPVTPAQPVIIVQPPVASTITTATGIIKFIVLGLFLIAIAVGGIMYACDKPKPTPPPYAEPVKPEVPAINDPDLDNTVHSITNTIGK